MKTMQNARFNARRGMKLNKNCNARCKRMNRYYIVDGNASDFVCFRGGTSDIVDEVDVRCDDTTIVHQSQLARSALSTGVDRYKNPRLPPGFRNARRNLWPTSSNNSSFREFGLLSCCC
jgi:hypothetical protein